MDFSSGFNLGICGGGQLGLLTLQKLIDWGIPISILDPSPEAVCRPFAQKFIVGSFKDYETVVRFGSNLDALCIEIDSVNSKALSALEKKGIRCYPSGNLLSIIQDKGLQKKYLLEAKLPTGPFWLIDSMKELKEKIFYPAVVKSRHGGYDGHGVKIIRRAEDLQDLFPPPYLLETKVDIAMELSVIAARNEKGEMAIYPPSEMIFHHEKNLLDTLVFPARISGEITDRVIRLSKKILSAMGFVGLLAIEWFFTKENELLINEVSPRAHNSGHLTKEACDISQYEMLARLLCSMPIRDPKINQKAVLINLLGESGYNGHAVCKNWESALQMPNLHAHFYGKRETRPLRKMGHITLTGDNYKELLQKAQFLKQEIKVVS